MSSSLAKYEVVKKPDENEEDAAREEWKTSLQFFFTVLGFCVGLGNIWRFPYLCQQNGGGAFVIPFLVMVVVEGMPLMLLELGVGQRFRRGSYAAWNRIHPWVGGIGLGSTVIAVVVGCYYNVIIAWCLYYLFMSLRPTLPWSECPPSPDNSTAIDGECGRSSETQFFWYRRALDVSEAIDDLDGGVRWWMLLSLTAAWALVYFVIMRGIQSSGKVVYFTALFPYAVLSIFFVRGLTLEGAAAGLAHMFSPDLNKLWEPRVWLQAATQVFYSFGLAFGSIVGFGSYNPVKKNCLLDVYVISACNAATAVFACAVVFAILGFKAQHLYDRCLTADLVLLGQMCDLHADASDLVVTEAQYHNLTASCFAEYQRNFSADLELEWPFRNCSLEKELNSAAQGTGLAFIVMADVFTMLPAAPVWSCLFFAMLLALGLGSQIGILEGVLGTLFDMPQLKGVKRPILSGAACLLCFCIGALFTTGAGEYWLTLFDDFGALGLTLVALAETVAVVYVYGHRRFTDDIERMTGTRPGWYWQIMWRFVAPTLLVVILVSSVVSQFYKKPEYSAWIKETGSKETRAYPDWCLCVAGFLATASVVPVAAVGALRMAGFNVLSMGDEGNNAGESTVAETEDAGKKLEGRALNEGEKC